MSRKASMTAEEHFKHGIDCLDAQDHDGAIADFTGVLRLCPDDISTIRYRGGARLEKGAFEAAIADYRKVLEADGENTVVLHNRGVVFSNKAMREKAIADFTEVIRNDPGFASAYFIRPLYCGSRVTTQGEGGF